MKETIVSVSSGKIKGKKTENGYEFLGIPYGSALRFQSPEPVAWEGVRDCLDYGSVAPQPNYLGVRPEKMEFCCLGGEDCLNLNVWTKCVDPGAGQPVVVYVHGGAFQTGCNSDPERSGDRFMGQEKMVFVSVNYRLGVLGFLRLKTSNGEGLLASGNQGMEDLRMATQWVKKEIRNFGGDPEHITLMGVSAGAKAIASLLTLPDVQEACRQVVLESGAMQSFRSAATAEAVGRGFLTLLGKGTDVRKLPLEELIRAQAEYCGYKGTTCYFGPVLDDVLFPSAWREHWERGERWQGSAIIGCGKNELTFEAHDDEFQVSFKEIITRLFGNNSGCALEKFRELLDEEENSAEAWTRVLSDFMYRFYSDRLAVRLSEEGNRVWCYSFEYPPACHGMGFFFLMDQWRGLISEQHENQLEAGALAGFMRNCVRRFILTGSPEGEDTRWHTFDYREKMIFDSQAHMEYRPDDTLSGFPEYVFQLG